VKSYGIARSPFLSQVVLHLLYECTLSNMRLKLAGGDRFKGNGGRVARSLRAIR